NFTFNTPHTAFFGVAPEVGGVETGVELERVIYAGHGHRPALALGAHKTLNTCGLGLYIEVTVVKVAAGLAPAHPVVDKVDAVHVHAEQAERMNVTLARAAPINEFVSQFERRIGFTHELVFIQP